MAPNLCIARVEHLGIRYQFVGHDRIAFRWHIL